MTPWQHLPNAEYIDQVFAHSEQHPFHWSEALREIEKSTEYYDSFNYAWGQAYEQVRGLHRTGEFHKITSKVWEGGRTSGDFAIRGYLLALVAHDDSPKYLNCSIGKLKMISLLFDGHPAILMLPAVVAFERAKEEG